MRKRIMGMVLALTMLSAFVPVIAGADMSIAVGKYVQMGTYNGEPILWRCVSIDDNGPLILSDKALCAKEFDKSGIEGSHSRDTNRQYHGSNYWADSNIRSWLNSTASAGNVEWLCGNTPSYNNEAGFLSNFTENERNAMKEVRQKSLLSEPEYTNGMAETGTEPYAATSNSYAWNNISTVVQNYNTAYAEYVTDKMFLMDVQQVNAVYNNRNKLGENYYIGEATEKSGLTIKWDIWLRSPKTDAYNTVLCIISSDGSTNHGRVNIDSANSTHVGVRPAFYLDLSSSIQSGTGTASNPYIIVNENVTPTASPTISPTAEPTPSPTATPTIPPTATPTTNPTATATPAATSYPYIINGLSLKTTGGAELDDINSIPSGASFMVNTSFTKVQPRNESDYVFVAVYGTEGNLLSLTYVQSNFADNYTYDVGFFIPAQTESIAKIKTFVWDAFAGMTPLAESKELQNSLEGMQ